jgi:hypothetical protein
MNGTREALKKFLLLGSFYSLNEYYEWNKRDDLGSYKQYVNLTSTALLIGYVKICTIPPL